MNPDDDQLDLDETTWPHDRAVITDGVAEPDENPILAIYERLVDRWGYDRDDLDRAHQHALRELYDEGDL